MSKNEKKDYQNQEDMTQSEKGKMFLKHCCKRPADVLRLGKATVLYGAIGLKERAGELARNEWREKKKHDINEENADINQLFSIRFSIIILAFDIDVKFLERTLDSIQSQAYDEWEVLIVDNGLTNLEQQLECRINSKIRIKHLEQKMNVVEALNSVAFSLKGDYLLFTQAGDKLHQNALREFAKNSIKTNADIIYSDKDSINNDGTHVLPSVRPDWSPDLMLSRMYLNDAIAIKTEQFKNVKGFDEQYKDIYIFDLVLRISEGTNNIRHIAKLLYSQGSTALTQLPGNQKQIVHAHGKSAIQDHLNRTKGMNAAKVADTGQLCAYDIRYNVDKKILVSIIIPTKDHKEDLKVALDSIFLETTYKNFEVIILDNNSEKEETRKYFEDIQKEHENVLVVRAEFEFNWSKLNNYGMNFAKGDVYVFLNNDVKVIEPTWLERLVEHAVNYDTGVVGGMLLYEDDSIQHAGVVIGMGGWADHVYKGTVPTHSDSPFVSPLVTRNVMACTGACMAISKKTIEKIGGFDERFIICGSDVEICIRAIEEGYKNVYVPQIKLYHYESKSRDTFIPEIDFELSDIMYSGYRKGGDPYYNTNLNISNCIPEISGSKKNEGSKLKTKPVCLENIRELHFQKESGKEYRLNLVLPALNAEYVFGGIATALSCFESMGEELNCSTRIILVDAEMDQKAKDKYSKKYHIVSSDERSDAKHQIVSMATRKRTTLLVSENDQFVFTAWWSAYIIQTEYRKWKESNKLILPPFIYLIQDYEPGFYAWSPKYVLAEVTYRYEYPQIAIFNSHELKDYILGRGYKFESVHCFDPLLNSVLKGKVQALDRTVYKRKQILVYGRPSVDRNAFEIIVESLRKWVAIQPGANSWSFLSAGEQHDPVALGEGLYLESVGKLTIEEYAKVLQESYAGISLMISPHPSYPPLEMAVFDAQVITNGYGNKDMSYFSENITSVDNVDPVLIASKLKNICESYRTVVEHKAVNHDYVYMTNPFGFIKELKKEIMPYIEMKSEGI